MGCCQRDTRDAFKKTALRRQLILSLPAPFHKKGRAADFARAYCEELNEYLQSQCRYAAAHTIRIDQIALYKIDGPSVGNVTDKDRFSHSAITQIQNAMTDDEQLMVKDLCQKRLLNDDSWLVKDGSLQYNPHFSSMDSAQWNNLRANYQRVVGVSKSFNPDLLKNYEGRHLARIIADLGPYERTKAYKYVSTHSNNQTFAIWYIRLRKGSFRETHFSDIVKCEMLMLNPSQPIPSDTIDAISANLIREAFPVCYGSDSRWANHLYPTYLTETFCKSQRINSSIFLSIF